MSHRPKNNRERKHIFCVNRDPAFLTLVRELLHDEQYNVTTTNYVPETFDQIAALQPDLLIIDLVVGEETGFSLLDALENEAITRGIPVIVVSTTPELLHRAQSQSERYSGDVFLVKPFDLEELLGAVRSLVDKSYR